MRLSRSDGVTDAVNDRLALPDPAVAGCRF